MNAWPIYYRDPGLVNIHEKKSVRALIVVLYSYHLSSRNCVPVQREGSKIVPSCSLQLLSDSLDMTAG